MTKISDRARRDDAFALLVKFEDARRAVRHAEGDPSVVQLLRLSTETAVKAGQSVYSLITGVELDDVIVLVDAALDWRGGDAAERDDVRRREASLPEHLDVTRWIERETRLGGVPA